MSAVNLVLPEEFGGSGPPWSSASGFVTFTDQVRARIQSKAFTWRLTNERQKWAGSFADEIEDGLRLHKRLTITVTAVHRV